MSSRARLPEVLALLAVLAAPLGAQQLGPPRSGGIGAIDRALEQVSEPRRVLMIGAHPDDEDTELLTYVVETLGGRAAYLSLSRGEGGQNLIGQELGLELGLLRSRELEAARSIDGAEQFFTRAYDFGFTTSLDETLRFWPADSLLADVVRVVRRFRPHVIVSVFSGTPRDGHGQHQAAGLMAQRAWEAAGDPRSFPDLAAEGLEPWTPLKLYVSTRFDTAATTLSLPTGGLDPIRGLTVHQIAMLSRSQHSSQDMGRLLDLGPFFARVRLVDSRVAGGAQDLGLFYGVPGDTTATGLLAGETRHRISPIAPDNVVPSLPSLMRSPGTDQRQREHLARALAAASGLVADAVTNDSTYVPGEPLTVTVQVHNAGRLSFELDSVAFRTGANITLPTLSIRRSVSAGAMATLSVTGSTGGALFTQPYFTTAPRQGYLYDWSAAPAAVRGLPFDGDLVTAVLHGRLLGAPVTLEQVATFRFNDQARGEQRRPVRIVPAIDVQLSPDTVVWVPTLSERVFEVRVTNNLDTNRTGTVSLYSNGSVVATSPAISLLPGQPHVVEMSVPRPADSDTTITLRAVASSGGAEFDSGIRTISYAHVRSTSLVVPATSFLQLADMALPAERSVGYVRGAADRVPEALAQLGFPVTLLSAADLANGDLSRYEAIVVGARAYEVDPALRRYNDRLLEWNRAGGTLIVQYQQYAFVDGRYAPFAFQIDRPHGRVTDETSPVTLLQPEHRVFRRPNAIRSEDWSGWPQERGLYFASVWGDEFAPLLELGDPGAPRLRGGLLVARNGAGTYVYTGLSFFRALPAGVPGAYRVFFNLIDLGAGN